MFEIALTVLSCLRAGTRAEVVWVANYDGPPIAGTNRAIAITPGGGKIGTLLSGALDGQLSDLVRSVHFQGRIATIEVSPVDALISGIPAGAKATCVVVLAKEFPDEVWSALVQRHPVCIICQVEGDAVSDISFFTADTVASACPVAKELFATGTTQSRIVDNTVVSVWFPVTRLVVAGLGPIADALNSAAQLLGWNVSVAGDPDISSGLMAGLSKVDAAVVMHHNIEDAGRALAGALDSTAGYIGGVGSRKMQQARADWLAYRGYADVSRIHGPAGLEIGAKSPPEIAVAVLAEALQSIRGNIS